MLPRNRLLQTAKRAVAIPVDWRFGRSRYAEKTRSHLPRGPAAPLNYPLNVVPRQNSSGGKPSLGRITKRGDTYLRTLLIQGAKSAVMSADKRDDATSRWLEQLIERVGWQKACVAMDNKNAPHPVGGDDARARLRCPACQRQTAGQAKAGASARVRSGHRLSAQPSHPRPTPSLESSLPGRALEDAS